MMLAMPRAGQALEHVVLQLKWQHQFQFAGYYAAVEKGYYREAGLDVELREAVPGHDPLEEVVDGHAQFGVGTSNVILARAAGKPLVVLAVIYQHSPFVLLIDKRSGVEDVHDLAQRPIMMEPDSAELLAYFQSEGMDPKHLKIVPHSFDVHDLINGKVAAMSAYATDEPFHLKEAGEDYLVFTPRAGGIDFYGDNLFTTEGEIRRHPERVRAFLAASLKGWEYAMAHRDELIDLILRKYNRGKSREQLEFEADETAQLVHPELIELGYINPGRWRDIANTYEKLGMLPANFSWQGFLYDRNPHVNLGRVYRMGGVVLLAAAVLLTWMLLLWRLNRKLRREVTARKEAEAVARAESAAKTHFYAVLAHEIRTPLAGVSSSLALCEGAAGEAERRELIDISRESAAQLLQMVDGMLDHSRLEAGKMAVEAEPTDVRSTLEELTALFQAAASAKGNILECQIADGLPATIRTDALRVRQIVSNLLSNAVKFTRNGTVRVRAEAREGRIVVGVSDTGIGIAPERLEGLFEPYTQERADTARRYGGTGLGLSIARQLARLLGGELVVQSVAGRGSVFTLEIPYLA